MINAVVVMLGIVVVVVGVFLIFFPAGVIATGVAFIAAGYLEAPRRETSRSSR